MNTNHERKNNQLSDTLATFFSKNINLAHIKLISLFMMAICKARTVFKAMKSAVFNIEDTHLTDIKRIEKLLLVVIMAFLFLVICQKEEKENFLYLCGSFQYPGR